MSTYDEIKSTVQQQFGRTADKYVTSPGHAKGDDLPLLVEWLSPQKDWVVLDIATGGGHVAKVLFPHVNKVFATDLTKPMLETARKFLHSEGCLNVDYVLADAENLPFLDASFDAVTCRIAAHHFPHPAQFVTEVSRVLKPGGKFLLIDNVAPPQADRATYLNTLEKMRDKSHVRCASIPEWSAWLTQSDLVILQERESRKSFSFQPWVRRMAETDELVHKVENYIRSAAGDMREYFSVDIRDEQVISLQVDKWMALAEKRPL